MDLWIIRFCFIVVVGVACFLLKPFGLEKIPAGVVGVAIGAAVVVFGMRLRLVSLKPLIGAGIGSTLRLFGAFLFSVVLNNNIPPPNSHPFLQPLSTPLLSYLVP